MLVTFMDEHWKAGKPSTEAAIVGAGERLRPILMTACAMTVGMVPMALALERGSQMQAPLGRAVIGGLVMSTFATLLVLPSIFAVVIGRKAARSPSIYPDDPESPHYDPQVFADEDESGDKAPPRGGPARSRLTRNPTEPATPRTAATRGPDPPSPRKPPLTWRSLMHRALRPTVPDRSAGCRRLVFWLLAALAAPGCGHEHKTDYTSVSEPPTVR